MRTWSRVNCTIPRYRLAPFGHCVNAGGLQQPRRDEPPTLARDLHIFLRSHPSEHNLVDHAIRACAL